MSGVAPGRGEGPRASGAAALGSIRATLLGSFLAISLGSVALVSILASQLAERTLERTILESLAALAETRAVQIEELVDARVSAVAALARDPSLVGAFAALRRGEAPSAELAASLGTIAQGLDFSALALVAADGRVLAAFGEASLPLEAADLRQPPWAGGPIASAVDRASTLIQADFAGLQPIPGRGRPALFVAGPILDGPRVAGVLVAQVDEAPIDAAIGNVTGLGETGQAVAAYLDGAALRVAAPLREDPGAAGVRTLSGVSEAYRRAVRGEGSVGYAVGPGGREVIGAWFHLPALRWSLSVEQDADEAFAPARRQRLAILAVAGATAIPAAFVALLVAGRIARPIRDASAALALAARGDLDHTVAVRGRGEIRGLLESLQRMVVDLGGMLLGIRSTGRELGAVAGRVRETATNQHRVVQDLSSSAAEIASAIEQMSATGRQLAATASGVAEVADETAGRAERGRQGLERMREAVGALDATSDSVGARLAEIRERADGVGAVIGTIARIASRTNLLSINAAIEAEKAGPHGRGFQVVAAEINRLSDQTAAAALEVESIVAGMQRSVAEGASAMDGLSGVVRSGVGIASSVSEDLAAILESVAALRGSFAELKGGIDAQSEGALQIRDAMRHLAASAENARAIVERLREAGDQLDRSAGSLQGSVERFRLPTR